MTPTPLLVGHHTDTHLRVVVERLRDRGCEPVVIDADSIGEAGYTLTPTHLTIGGTELPPGDRGWLRRIAPTRWTTGHTVGSVSDVTFRARVHLIAAIARQPGRRWLTTVDALQRAEDRIHQLGVAASLGFATPRTVIGSDIELIKQLVGNDVVVKPLASGAFVDNDQRPHTVHTTVLGDELAEQADFAAAPFVVQERITVVKHLRVVTAGVTVRTASLDAHEWPLDWRTADDAHSAWVPHADASDVEQAALALAQRLDLGYSSQDWLTRADGSAVFIDLNPAGQWMFLPPAVADPITDHIVDYLTNTT